MTMTREEAIERLKWVDPYNVEAKDLEAIAVAIEALSVAVSREDTVTLNSPISIQAEMVAVVRCKDCRHAEHCHETVAHTRLHDGFKEHWSEQIEWCSRGERKGGEDE